MVHSGYHPLKHRPLRIVIGQCTVDILSSIVLLGQCLNGAQWISHSQASSSQDSAWIVHSGYPLKHRPLRVVLGQCTVDIIISSIVLLGQCLDSAQLISSQASSSQDSACIVHSGYLPLKYRPLRIVLGQCTVDILSSIALLGQSLGSAQWISSSQVSSSQDSAWIVHCGYPLKHRPSQDSARIVHSGYPLKRRPLRIVLGQCTSGYHPLKHRPLRIVLVQCTVDIILSSIVLLGQCLDSAQMDIILCTVDILSSIVLLGQCLDSAQWISSS